MIFTAKITLFDGVHEEGATVELLTDTGSSSSWVYKRPDLTVEHDEDEEMIDGCWHADGSGVEGYWSNLSSIIGEVPLILGTEERGGDRRDGVLGLGPESVLGPGSPFSTVSFHFDTDQAINDRHHTFWDAAPPSYMVVNGILPETDRSSYVFSKCLNDAFTIRCRIQLRYIDGTRSRFSRVSAKVDTGCSHLYLTKNLDYRCHNSPLSAVILEIKGNEFAVPSSHFFFDAQPGSQSVTRIGIYSDSYKLGNGETVVMEGQAINIGVAALSTFTGVVFETGPGGNQVGFLR